MNRQEIETKIRQHLSKLWRDASEPQIRIQRDPFRGWNIAVISNQFADETPAHRREVIMPALEGVEVEWLDLLMPEEVAWAGPLPAESSPESLPLWPEALARVSLDKPTSVTLASDRDDDLKPPIVATFYSLRGGVGRSTALVHTARILASRRWKVVCVDMDLEAPALPVLLGCEGQLDEDHGVVDLLMALDQGTSPDFASHLLQAPESDNLFVLPAGRVSADYARKLRFVNPAAWYREESNPLRLLLDGLRDKLPFKPDVILFDARTGVTDLSGPLLFDLADLAIIAFFPHPQAQAGTELLTRSILRTTSRRVLSDGQQVVPEVRFLVSPVPMSGAAEIKSRYEQRPLEWIEVWLRDFNTRRVEQGIDAIDPRDITHAVHYREDIATSDSAFAARTASIAFEPIAEWIQRFLRTSDEEAASMPAPRKAQALEDLRFSAGAAEEQNGLLDEFLETDDLEAALSSNTPLVLGRKGTGKTAVFRFLSERANSSAVVVHAPSALQKDYPWQLSASGFAAVDKTLHGHEDLSWRNFWLLYAAIAVDSRNERAVSRPDFLADLDIQDEAKVVDALDRMSKEPHGNLLLNGWLKRLDANAAENTLLLFDGLDTGFGSNEDERARRRRSVEGLFDARAASEQLLSKLKFKIMLREDIWRQLNFQNKSHLFGKSVRLKWSDKTSFLKVVVKQAMHAASFGALLPTLLAKTTVDQWSDEAVQRAWTLLVGERMKGGQTAYTRNWVWSRLADANDDHSPRHLLQLFQKALEWEKQEEKKLPYEKAVIRPRALVECLASVSEQAVGALREEFPELESLFETLTKLRRTPVDAAELEQHEALIPLAREVGLLAVYEESGDTIRRYKIPDLYRQGLQMTRMGQT